MLEGKFSKEVLVKIVSPLVYGGGLVLLYFIPMFSLLFAIAVTFLIFYLLNKALVWSEKDTKPSILDHIRQSSIYYTLIVALLIRVFLNTENITFSVIGTGLTAIIAIIINGVSLYRKHLFSYMVKISKRVGGIEKIKRTLFLVIGFFAVWQIIFHNDYWIYVGKDIFRDKVSSMVVHNLACGSDFDYGSESDKHFSENWREQSRIYGFDYNDVKFTIEDVCPIEDVEVDAPSESYRRHVEWMQTLDKTSYDKEKREWEKRIEIGEKIRAYKIKFLNRDFSVFQEDLKNGK